MENLITVHSGGYQVMPQKLLGATIGVLEHQVSMAFQRRFRTEGRLDRSHPAGDNSGGSPAPDTLEYLDCERRPRPPALAVGLL